MTRVETKQRPSQRRTNIIALNTIGLLMYMYMYIIARERFAMFLLEILKLALVDRARLLDDPYKVIAKDLINFTIILTRR